MSRPLAAAIGSFLLLFSAGCASGGEDSRSGTDKLTSPFQCTEKASPDQLEAVVRGLAEKASLGLDGIADSFLSKDSFEVVRVLGESRDLEALFSELARGKFAALDSIAFAEAGKAELQVVFRATLELDRPWSKVLFTFRCADDQLKVESLNFHTYRWPP